MRRRSASVWSAVRAANIGATPIGSIVTSSVTKLAIQGSMGRSPRADYIDSRRSGQARPGTERGSAGYAPTDGEENPALDRLVARGAGALRVVRVDHGDPLLLEPALGGAARPPRGRVRPGPRRGDRPRAAAAPRPPGRARPERGRGARVPLRAALERARVAARRGRD